MNKKDALSILGLTSQYTISDAKAAYKKLAMHHHPDRGGDANSFKKIKAAYDFLKLNSVDVHALNAEFFNINISAKEAFNGGIKLITSPIELSVSILPGIYNGQILEIKEINNKKISICAKIVDNNFKIDFSNESYGDIIIQHLICPFKMIMGGWETIQTIDDSTTSVRIPAGLESNKIIKIKEKGYWKKDKRNRGDFYIKMIPDIKKIDFYKLNKSKSIIEFINQIS